MRKSQLFKQIVADLRLDLLGAGYNSNEIRAIIKRLQRNKKPHLVIIELMQPGRERKELSQRVRRSEQSEGQISDGSSESVEHWWDQLPSELQSENFPAFAAFCTAGWKLAGSGVSGTSFFQFRARLLGLLHEFNDVSNMADLPNEIVDELERTHLERNKIVRNAFDALETYFAHIGSNPNLDTVEFDKAWIEEMADFTHSLEGNDHDDELVDELAIILQSLIQAYEPYVPNDVAASRLHLLARYEEAIELTNECHLHRLMAFDLLKEEPAQYDSALRCEVFHDAAITFQTLGANREAGEALVLLSDSLRQHAIMLRATDTLYANPAGVLDSDRALAQSHEIEAEARYFSSIGELELERRMEIDGDI